MADNTNGKALKVWFFTHYFPPESNAPASRTYETCKRWAAAGYDVTVITCPPHAPHGKLYDGYSNAWTSKEVIDGINVVRVKTYIAANKGFLKRILNFVSYMLSAFIHIVFMKRPDIIIATSPQFFCGWAGVLAKWAKRRPFILEIRDIWPETILTVGAMKKSLAIRVLEWLEVKMYKAATHIVTVGEGYARKIEAKGVDRRDISIVTNGVDSEIFQPMDADQSLLKQYGLTDKFVCSYTGTIGMCHGLDVIIPVAEKLKQEGKEDITIVMVGDGACREDIEMQAKSKGLNNILFTGRQSKEMMPKWLSVSDCCLVHLQNTELFTTVLPSKMFEVCAMKKPIVLGVKGEAEKLLDAAKAGICVEPENADEIKDALVRLHGSEALCKEYGESGYEHIMSYYNRDTLASDYLKVVHEVAGK